MFSDSSIKTAALIMAAGVALGAFGAHALKARVEPSVLDIWEKAVFYHLIHGLGLFLIALLIQQNVLSIDKGAKIFTMMAAGIVIFSGSLYLLVLSGKGFFGAITPVGGVLLIVSWIILAFA